MAKNVASQYASTHRSKNTVIDRQKKLLAEYYSSLNRLYNAVIEMILIVNQDRQIVFFTSKTPSLLGFEDPERLYGLRLGEALGCINACRNPGGCGTSEYCSQCGAVNAILSALNRQGDLRECRVLKENSIEAMDLLIKTTPLEIKGQMFGIIAITDISHEKRRRVLEHIFFHDLMNTAASIKLFARIIDADPETITSNKNWQNLVGGLNQLIAELQSQKELLAAENNELAVRLEPVDGHLLLKEVVEAFKEQNPDCRIVLDEPGQRIILNTDQRLLRRVLENMVLNALEASKSGEMVTVSCKIEKGFAEFSVHNHGHIPKEHQLQLFQRSFTTKGIGRGLGTYSIKLLSERYLQGSISFKSSIQQGTTFVARYPVSLDHNRK